VQLEVKVGTLAVTSEGLTVPEGVLDVRLEGGGMTLWASRVPRPSRIIPEPPPDAGGTSELTRLYGVSLYIAPIQVCSARPGEGCGNAGTGGGGMYRGLCSRVCD
jgi:hypothetical protein